MLPPSWCRKCAMVTGHNPAFGLKIKCNRCGDVTPVPIFRWIAGTLLLAFLFGVAFYFLYSSLKVLWPLFLMPFIDYDTGVATFIILLIPGYLAFAWITGRIIK
jgi:hypothetical protein